MLLACGSDQDAHIRMLCPRIDLQEVFYRCMLLSSNLSESGKTEWLSASTHFAVQSNPANCPAALLERHILFHGITLCRGLPEQMDAIIQSANHRVLRIKLLASVNPSCRIFAVLLTPIFITFIILVILDWFPFTIFIE